MVVLTRASCGALLALVAPLRTHLLFAKVSLILPLPDSCCRPQDLKPVAKVWNVPQRPTLAEDSRLACEVLEKISAQLYLSHVPLKLVVRSALIHLRVLK